jgi:type I restriction enzyme S subunit
MSEEATLNDFAAQGESDGDSGEHPRFGSLPDRWGVSEIAKIAEVVGGSTPSTSNENYWGGGIPWATPTDITALSGNTISETEDTISDEGLGSASTHLLPPNSVLMTSRATIGKCAVNTVEMATNQGFKNLVPSDEIEAWYLYYRMLDTAAFLNSLGSGSTFDEVSKTEVQSVDIPVPPLPEQRKIATVLYTVDRAIKIADNILEQAKRVEQGLQQTLFTGEQLSCERKEAPTIGQVPVNWQIKAMGEVCNITMGSSPKSEHYNESGNGLPFFQANNEFGLRNPKHDRWCSNPIKTANKGDSLMTLRGTYVGQMNIADRKCCIGRGLAGVSAGEELLEEYLYQHLRRRERYVKSIAIGSTFDSVSSSELENLPIVIPPKEKQEEIAKTLRSVQERLRFTNEYTEQLHRLKRGLMQDLLSGTVRTTDTNIEVPEEIAQYG